MTARPKRKRPIRIGDYVRLRSSGKYGKAHIVTRTVTGDVQVRILNDVYRPTHRTFQRAEWER